LQGNDGNFYGTTEYQATSNGIVFKLGTIFQVTPGGTLSTLVQFNGSNGAYPSGSLVQCPDGSFLGTTNAGGTTYQSVANPGKGTLFRVTPDGTLSTLVNFTGTNGVGPGTLVQGSDGNFYGVTGGGGSAGYGTLFQISAGGAFTTFVNFSYAYRDPYGVCLQSSDGDFYGTINNGTVSDVFRASSNGTITTIASVGYTDIGGSLVESKDGNLYGTTSSAFGNADYGHGTVFRVSPNGTLVTLAHFNGPNGLEPEGRMIQGPDGNFYGTTVRGGSGGYGTLFRVNPDGTLDTLVSFDGDSEGAYPRSGVIFGSDGNLYGTSGNVVYHVLLSTPSPIALDTPTGISATVATLNGRVNPGGTDAKVTFEYGLTSNYGSTMPSQDIGEGTGAVAVSTVISGLASHTQYHYRIVERSGQIITVGADATFSIIDTPPVANNASIHAPLIGVDTTIYSTAANTSDADGDAVIITSVVGGGDEISVSPDGSAVRYINPGFVGSKSYVVNVSDGVGGTASATLTVSNAAPIANNYHASIEGGAAVQFPVLSVNSDSDDDALTIVEVGQPAHGAAVVTQDGIVYRPAAKFRGNDSFSYAISDGRGGAAFGTVNIDVAPVGGVSCTLTTTVNNPAEGTVSTAKFSRRILNDQYTITAVPERGYSFLHWTGSDINGPILPSASNPFTFTMTKNLRLTAYFTPILSSGTVAASVGGPIPGRTNGTFTSFGIAQTEAFLGTMVLNGGRHPAVFDRNGSILLAGTDSAGPDGTEYGVFGQLSGDAVLATLEPGMGNVTSRSNAVLVLGLSTEYPAVTVRTGMPNVGLPSGVTIKNFLTLDGNGTYSFFLAVLQGAGVTSENKLALCAVTYRDNVNILARTGDAMNDGRIVSRLITLTGSAGTLAAGGSTMITSVYL